LTSARGGFAVAKMIKDFLEKLAMDKNEGLAARFEEAPVSVMVQEGLDPSQRNLIMNEPIAKIRKKVEDELKAAHSSDPVYVIRVKRG
jgi:hypothetical protein